MQYHFFDEKFATLFDQESKLSVLIKVFTSLSVFVACLGVLGLVGYMAEQRTKEIGIRKVFGASVLGLAFLLSQKVIKLMILAFLITSPIAMLIAKSWLDGFSYHIDLSIWPLIFVGIGALGIALLAISTQSIKAATANPIVSLRNE